jgi:hypothetical protein
VATNEIGDDVSHFIDMGINSSHYNTSSWTVNGANDGYLYVDSGNLALGTTASNIVFFTGGTLSSNIQATITAQGLVVANTVTSAGFYGPLTGAVTGNVTGNVTGSAGYVANSLLAGTGLISSGGAYNGSAGISFSLNTATLMAQSVKVVNGIYSTDTGTVSNNMLAGSIPNSKLAFSYITLTSGAGIGVSVASPSLGGSTVISNLGVTQITTGTGIRVSASTGSVQVSFANDAGYLTSSTVSQYALTNITPTALNSTTHIAATISGTTATIITDATSAVTPNTIVVRDTNGNINVSAWTINTVLTATNYTATVNNYWIGCSAKNLTITLPQTASQGRQYIIVDAVQSGNPGDTVVAAGGTTVVGGSLTQQGQSKMCVFHGTTWYCN